MVSRSTLKTIPVFLSAFLTLSLSVAFCIAADETKSAAGNTDTAEEKKNAVKPVIIIETSMGTIKAELWPGKAGETVRNVLRYTDEKFYDGLIFHRVIKGFMVQGGGFTPDMRQKSTHKPVKNEARTDTPNDRGTLAMARTSAIDSATSQFFINLVDNGFLNHKNDSARGFGYCVFGKVIEGMDIVDKIANTRTTRAGGMTDVPATPVTIKSIRQAK